MLARLLKSKTICTQVKSGRRVFSKLGLTFNQSPQTQHQHHHQPLKSSSFNNVSKYLSFMQNDTKNNQTGSNIGLFGKKELSSHEGFYLLKERAEKAVNKLVSEAFESGHRSERQRKMVEIFDDISNELCCVADLAEFVRTSHPDEEFRQTANYAYACISQLVEKLNTNRELYIKLKDSLNARGMDDCDKRVCKLFLVDFEQSGIHLDEKYRQQFVNVNDELVNLLMNFQTNSQVPSVINIKNVDPKFKQLVQYYNDPIRIDSMFIASDDELLREFVFKTYLKSNPQQEDFFRSILIKRKDIANLCGFETYSHRANANMIMENPNQVMEFLNECSKQVWSKANDDYEQMRQFKRERLDSQHPLMQWDIPYISNKIKAQKLELNKAFYVNYLSLGSCIEGINLIFNHLFNVNLEIENCEPGELWNQSIYKLAVKDAKQGLLGYIYCDFYHRDNKFSNVDCHFTIQCSKLIKENTYQLPIVVLHLNFPPPTGDKPTLLTFEMMENLFHEFGHAIHSMFAKTRYQHVSGTRCSTDLAEVPSQLMEYYCREPKILKMFAKHYSTLEPIDDRTLHKLCESKKLFSSCELQTQILNSALDQAFHLHDFGDRNLKPIDLIEKYMKQYHSLPYVPGTHWHLRFNHLVGYGAKYYSYLVSKAIAAQIWSECFAKDPLSSSAGANYRQKVLEFGGEKRPQELISSLIGFDLNTNSLVNSLVRNI